ncbi:nucleolar protein 56 [Lactuca sativa]|uniref:nucleolar protein 56 n=1 Tax=Lactuca sativa TaxID=4236 RepID=UPI000CD94783|nr:nucleolar protein 56 [Lactuca sativa]
MKAMKNLIVDRTPKGQIHMYSKGNGKLKLQSEREWYSRHFPKLLKIVNDNYLYSKLAKYINDKSELSRDKLDGLVDIFGNEDKAKEVIGGAKVSMGQDLSPVDLVNVQMFAKRVMDLAKYRKKLNAYLVAKMSDIVPNLVAFIGEVVGAHLISHAGSLTNLSRCPSSTLQILGAEKALFRALKSKGNTAKYGLIFHSSIIRHASAKTQRSNGSFTAQMLLDLVVGFDQEAAAVVIGHLVSLKMETELMLQAPTCHPYPVDCLTRHQVQHFYLVH